MIKARIDNDILNLILDIEKNKNALIWLSYQPIYPIDLERIPGKDRRMLLIRLKAIL